MILSGVGCGLYSSSRYAYGTPVGTLAPMSGATRYGDGAPKPLTLMMNDPLAVRSMNVPWIRPWTLGEYVTAIFRLPPGGMSNGGRFPGCDPGWKLSESVVTLKTLSGSDACVLNTTTVASDSVQLGLLPKFTSRGWMLTPGAQSGPGFTGSSAPAALRLSSRAFRSRAGGAPRLPS